MIKIQKLISPKYGKQTACFCYYLHRKNMHLSTHYIMSSAFNFQNSKRKDFCPRCIQSFTNGDGEKTPRLLDFYKNLCRSSKCLIHGKSLPYKQKIEFKNKNKAYVYKLKRQKKPLRITVPRAPCRVVEFEDDGSDSINDIDPQLYAKIEATLVDYDVYQEIKLHDIVGHKIIKEVINRTIIWPLKKPEIFKGLRSPPKGVLLFGPPGTGKSLIGKCIAFETKSTFFNISASSLTSKWMGESEKLVQTLFIVAKARQPSVIFIDEIDSILSQRTSEENGSSRRMKNEFFLYMDSGGAVAGDRIMIIGATSRPQELDEAARCRFFKRLYIPLPDEISRKELLVQLLQCECHSLDEADINDIVRKTEGYSIADLKNLSQEAAMGPIKSLSANAIICLQPDKVRPILIEDFLFALQLIKPSVSKEEVAAFENWDCMFGYGGECKKN